MQNYQQEAVPCRSFDSLVAGDTSRSTESKSRNGSAQGLSPAYLFEDFSFQYKVIKKFETLLELKKLDIMAITDFWIYTSDRELNSEFSVPESKMYSWGWTSREGVGVLRYMKGFLKFGRSIGILDYKLIWLHLEIINTV